MPTKAIFLAAAAIVVSPMSAVGQALPNIIIFVVDDMGVMDCSVPFIRAKDGKPLTSPLNAFYRTPHLAELASRGVRLGTFYATNLCSPTRISLLTGQNSARHRTTMYIDQLVDNRGPFGPPDWNWAGLKHSDLTLPRLLASAGYRTIHVGKGHLAPRGFEGEDPRNAGFDVSIAGGALGAPISYLPEEQYGAKPSERSKPYMKENSLGAVPGLEKHWANGEFLTDALTAEANAQIESAVAEQQPFFLYLAHYAVHAPFNYDSRFAPHYEQSGRSHAAGNFAALIEGVDKSLGEVVRQVEALGVAENTLLFFLGDNGTDAPLGSPHDIACAEPLRGKKGTHYEGGARVPFVAAWLERDESNPWQRRLPVAAGAYKAQVATVCDLLPTVASLVGAVIPTNHTIDGASLEKLLAGRPDPDRREVCLLHFPHGPHNSEYFSWLRTGPWKIVYHYFGFERGEGPGQRYELFNLDADPSESQNLADDQPGQLRSMMTELVAALESRRAAYPVDKSDPMQRVKPIVP